MKNFVFNAPPAAARGAGSRLMRSLAATQGVERRSVEPVRPHHEEVALRALEIHALRGRPLAQWSHLWQHDWEEAERDLGRHGAPGVDGDVPPRGPPPPRSEP